LHDVWPSPALVHYIYTFSGPLVPWRNFASCKTHFTSKSYVLLYWQHYCTALQQRASAKLWHGTRNGITELTQRAPPIFGWAAITLGIWLHSNFDLCNCEKYLQILMPAVMWMQVGGGTSGLDEDSSSPDDEDFRSIAFPPDDAIQKVL